MSKKSNFLKHPQDSYQLHAENIDILAEYFKKKHNIKIIKNGLYSSAILQQKKEVIKNKIQDLRDPARMYYSYMRDHFIPGACRNDYFYISEIFGSGFQKHFDQIKSVINPFLTNKKLKSDLSESDKDKINSLISNLPTPIKALFDSKIPEYISTLNEQYEDVCVSGKEAIAEIKHLQSRVVIQKN